VTGAAPVVTLAADRPAYTDGDPFAVTAIVTDADTLTQVMTGTEDALGRTFTQTTQFVDRAEIATAVLASGEPVTVTGLTVTGTARVDSGPLQLLIRDAQGHEVPKNITLAVAPRMLIGVTALPSDLPGHAKLYPGLAYARVYTPQGKGIYGWSSAAMLAALATGAEIQESFKDTPTRALLQPWFDAIPANVARISLTVHHEPEGDLPIPQYQADWKFLRAFRDSHPNGHKVVLVEDLTLYAELHGKGPASAWWSGYADKIALDCYRNAIAGDTYPAPATLFAMPAAVAAQLGVGWMVPEFGGDRISTDTTGTGRAAWMTACAVWAAAHGCEAIAWFCEPGTTSKAPNGYHLDQCPPELAAWQTLCATQRA
jgi:hypothetical protein